MKAQKEIPKLKALGLYPAKTIGDGNCLFNAFSDQLYGDESHHFEIRKATVEYMRSHPDQFKHFIEVPAMAPARRNPKRKNTGALGNRPVPIVQPTQAQIDKAFEEAVDKMAKGGVWGDNPEIYAFAHAYNVSVQVYSEIGGFFVAIEGSVSPHPERQTVWIVFHDFPHFSSIRNIDGPHSGLPCVPAAQIKAKIAEQAAKESTKAPHIESWMVDIALKSLPHPLNLPTNRDKIKRTLSECKGNVNFAVSRLLPDSSPEDSSRSSSIERDPDSDDENAKKPNKKRDRRLSRPHPLRNGYVLHVTQKDQISPDPRRLAAALQKLDAEKEYDPDETEEEDWPGGLQSKKSLSSSTTTITTSTSEIPTQESNNDARVRLKLTAPKKPAPKESAPKEPAFKKPAPKKPAPKKSAIKKPAIKSNKTSSQSSAKNSQKSKTDDEDDEGKDAPRNEPKPKAKAKAKPRRRLVPGNQIKQESDENDTHQATNQKLDKRIQAIHI